jgi:hypothetical protein
VTENASITIVKMCGAATTGAFPRENLAMENVSMMIKSSAAVCAFTKDQISSGTVTSSAYQRVSRVGEIVTEIISIATGTAYPKVSLAMGNVLTRITSTVTESV